MKEIAFHDNQIDSEDGMEWDGMGWDGMGSFKQAGKVT